MAATGVATTMPLVLTFEAATCDDGEPPVANHELFCVRLALVLYANVDLLANKGGPPLMMISENHLCLLNSSLHFDIYTDVKWDSNEYFWH